MIFESGCKSRGEYNQPYFYDCCCPLSILGRHPPQLRLFFNVGKSNKTDKPIKQTNKKKQQRGAASKFVGSTRFSLEPSHCSTVVEAAIFSTIVHRS
jgi:hypothetical protein